MAAWRCLLVVWCLCMVAVVGCGPFSAEPEAQLPDELEGVPGIQEAGPLAYYQLYQELEPEERRLTGRQQVFFPNRTGAELNQIVFRLYPNLPQYGGRMTVGPVWVDGELVTATLRAEGTSAAISLAQPLAPGAGLTISMTFEVEIPQRTDGYVLFGHSQGVWSLPDAYPLLAVHDGLTWHEGLAPSHGDAVFAEAAIYEVTLMVPPDLTLAATGLVVGEGSEAGGKRRVDVVGGPLREFAWLASPDYAVSETTAHGATVRSYYLPGDEAAGQAALSTAAAALRAYADAFGAYPYSEMAVVEAPLDIYGMEYPGLNLIGVSLYRDQRDELENRVAHEIAHQWWYAQVGNDQVNVPWLDEGLAEYSTAEYYRQVYGQARANRLINQRWLVPYQVAVDNGRDTVVNQPSAAFGPEYEVIVYGKAALFFDALHRQLGAEVYRAVVAEYLERFRWSIARPDDLLQVAEQVSGQELAGLFYHWILSKE